MPIINKTTEVTEVTRVSTSGLNFVPGEFEQVGAEFDAPYLAHSAESLNFKFAVVASSKTNRVGVIGFDGNKLKRNRILAARAWQVADSKRAAFAHQLQRNSGVLDAEYDRIRFITGNFQYSQIFDPQQYKMYRVEGLLPRSADRTLSQQDRHTIRDRLNAKLGLQPRDHGFIMSAQEAIDLSNEVFAMHNINNIDCFLAPAGAPYAAACRLRGVDGTKIGIWQFDVGGKMQLNFNSGMRITRGVVLHEIAHALDRRKYGGWSHGPSFALTYAELIGAHTSIGFENALSHFLNNGLHVANPVSSPLFNQLPRGMRDSYIRADVDAKKRR